MAYTDRGEILGRFASLDLDAEARDYLAYNARRYVRLLGQVSDCRRALHDGPIRILDVGPSYFTGLLRDTFPEDAILALGIEHPASRGGHWPPALALDAVDFHAYDLREVDDRQTWPRIPVVQIIVFSEVLEHLATAPAHVVAFLASLLAPGGLLLLTTPNAATVPKRLRFALLGKNPIPLYRENSENPGHFREYSQDELIAVGTRCGLEVVEARIYNDCYALELDKYHTAKGRLIRALSDFAPESMRENHYITFRKPES